MSTQRYFTAEESDGVAVLTLDRPQLHNAFDDLFIAQLTAELDALASRKEVRALVIAANGKSFSAGADLNWMRRMAEYTHQENVADARALGRLLQTLYELPKPVIGRVQGAAFGGGVGLVACCDIVIASEEASFCLSEVRLGLVPAMISPYVVNAIGERQARRYFVTAESFSALEAERLGLVHEVVASENLDQRIEAVLGRIRANGPLAMASAKKLAESVSRGPLDQSLSERNAECIASVRASQEGREGVGAFLEKRKPAWINR
jgi:methylglutaconyl-CoA hydratase